ncbi:hypothetical protein OAJ78_05430 [Gammaproteobacteria bacterium]|nr:hypothetical protein [Gammaproteobacteria bacterium]
MFSKQFYSRLSSDPDINWIVIVVNLAAIGVLLAALVPKIDRHGEVIFLLLAAGAPLVLTIIVCLSGRFRRTAIVANSGLIIGSAAFIAANGMDDPYPVRRSYRSSAGAGVNW